MTAMNEIPGDQTMDDGAEDAGAADQSLDAAATKASDDATTAPAATVAMAERSANIGH